MAQGPYSNPDMMPAVDEAAPSAAAPLKIPVEPIPVPRQPQIPRPIPTWPVYPFDKNSRFFKYRPPQIKV